MSFSWVPFYRELAGRVLEFEEKQDELLQFVLQMHSDGIFGKTAKTLDAIDPFTFFSLINVLGLEKRKKACEFLAKTWDLKTEPPFDFFGVPEINPQGCWFFDYEPKRTSFDIPSLWELSKAVCYQSSDYEIAPLFYSCLKIHTVGFTKMTIGLFWFEPERFLPLDQHMKAMLKRSNIYWDEKAVAKGDWGTYISVLEQIKIIFGDNFPQISRNAWLEKDLSKSAAFSPPLEETTEATILEVEPPKAIMPLNQILYGPPGTGKTYNSIQEAVKLIDGKIESDAQAKARFEELRKAGQIEFVTFHQSFSYEEFIEGLRPVIGDESGQVSYEIRPGILKKMALDALGEGLQKVESGRVAFEQLWEAFLQEISEETERTYKGLTEGTEWKIEESVQGLKARNLRGVDPTDFSTCRKSDVQRIWAKFAGKDALTTAEVKAVLGRRRRLIVCVFNQFKRLEKNLKPNAQNVKADLDSAQSFLSGSADYRPNFSGAKKFVLIIDEINRGNISKILGELITLLEDDKRIGADNELRLTLPTSGETFALPPNLFILGTMNTSDKSLAQLDVALRRRFSFQEMPPELWRCTKLDGLEKVLEELNNRLEWALDREHRLGHAYFMEVDAAAAFDEVFRLKIVPLLIEYFPHDFQTLRAVLGEKGDGFLREMAKPKDFQGSGKKYRWWFECGDEGFSAFARLKSNYEV